MSNLRSIWMLFVCIGFISLNSCIPKSRQELIIGTWTIDSNAVSEAVRNGNLTFYKDLTVVYESRADGKTIRKDEATYTFNHDGKYLVIQPPGKEKPDEMEIIELTTNRLKLLDHDTLVITLKKIK